MKSTYSKLESLDKIIKEYKMVVNVYIEALSKKDRLNSFVDFGVKTWLSSRLQQCAGKQAVQIIKSVRKKDKEIRFKKYKKVYNYFKSMERLDSFTNKRFSELRLNPRIVPIYNADVIEFDERFIQLQKSNNSFEMWFHIQSIGNRIILDLPCNGHKHFNKFNDWTQLKSFRLRKTSNGKFFMDVFFKKEIDEDFIGENEIGLDVGINTLISLSNGEQYGIGFKELLKKLNRKEQKSKSWFKCLDEIKNFIGQTLNKLDFKNTRLLVLEDLKRIAIGTKQERRANKTTRKYLSKWNLGTFQRWIKNKCEVSRTQLAFVNPRYTSRTCPICGYVDKKNRNGEYFLCHECGHEDNADVNGAVNILQRFYQPLIVADSGKALYVLP
jgi:putative transposase